MFIKILIIVAFFVLVINVGFFFRNGRRPVSIADIATEQEEIKKYKNGKLISEYYKLENKMLDRSLSYREKIRFRFLEEEMSNRNLYVYAKKQNNTENYE